MTKSHITAAEYFKTHMLAPYLIKNPLVIEEAERIFGNITVYHKPGKGRISEKEIKKIKKDLEYNANSGHNPHSGRIIMFPIPKLTNEYLKKHINRRYL